MTFGAFLASLSLTAPPELSPPLLALWRDARGDWEGAHKCVDERNDPDSMWVHAYLHRKEGDRWNASYWYRRAGKPVCEGPLDLEQRALTLALLGKSDA